MSFSTNVFWRWSICFGEVYLPAARKPGDNQLVLDDSQEGLAQKHLQHRVPREDQAFRMNPGRSVVGHAIPLAYPYQDTVEDDFSFLSQGGDMFVCS